MTTDTPRIRSARGSDRRGAPKAVIAVQSREKQALAREDSAHLREGVVDRREEAALMREAAAQMREIEARTREGVATCRESEIEQLQASYDADASHRQMLLQGFSLFLIL